MPAEMTSMHFEIEHEMGNRPGIGAGAAESVPGERAAQVLAVPDGHAEGRGVRAGGRGDAGLHGHEGGVRGDGRWAARFAGRFNGGEPVKVGGMRAVNLFETARDTAALIRSSSEPLAVTMDSDGCVYVEPVISAAEDELVGVYSSEVLPVTIFEDLRLERDSRDEPQRAESTTSKVAEIVNAYRHMRTVPTAAWIANRAGVGRATAHRARKLLKELAA